MSCPARQRSIGLSDISTVPFLTGHLIDGGRWLIALNEDGWLFCWDLDASDVASTCTVLATASTGFQEDVEPNAVSSLQIVEGTEQLAFRFALLVSIQDWDTCASFGCTLTSELKDQLGRVLQVCHLPLGMLACGGPRTSKGILCCVRTFTRSLSQPSGWSGLYLVTR